jgi:hypothetical protein
LGSNKGARGGICPKGRETSTPKAQVRIRILKKEMYFIARSGVEIILGYKLYRKLREF